jgi:hypothetical protein
MKRLVCLWAMPALLCGDWKIVTRTTGGTLTEYFKGSVVRTDSSPVYTSVLDFEQRRQINWRSDLRQYEIIEWPPELPPKASGPTIVIEHHTTDAGERKQFFGRTARRLISRIKRSDGPETVIDGWYVDGVNLPKQKGGAGGSFAVLTIVDTSQGPPRIEMKQTGPPPDGLPVWQKTTSSFALPGGPNQVHESVSVVTELSEGLLPGKVFEAPDGFQRVTNLPYDGSGAAPPRWGEAIRLRWQKIGEWFSGLF